MGQIEYDSILPFPHLGDKDRLITQSPILILRGFANEHHHDRIHHHQRLPSVGYANDKTAISIFD
jgi:hypothetical protein